MVDENTVLMLLSSVIAFLFFIILFYKYMIRRDSKFLYWSIGLLFMFFAYLINFFSLIYSWNNLLFDSYYFFAMANVGFLGLGSVSLINKNKITMLLLTYNIIMSLIFLFAILFSKTNPNLVLKGNFNAFPAYVSLLGALITVPGAIFLIFISLYSAVKLKNNRNALLYNSLIALGAIIFSADGSLTLSGNVTFYYTFLFLGLVLMFTGFLNSISFNSKIEVNVARDLS